MPVTNSTGCTLGRGVVDVTSLPADCPPWLRKILEQIQATLIGGGWPAAARGEDEQYQWVYAKLVSEEWLLYGGKPSDPVNPDLITVSAAGSATMIIQWEGSVIGTRGTINFTGAGVNAVTDDAGNTRVDVDISGGGGGGNAFTTIAVATQDSVVADSSTDTLTLVAGDNIVITTDASGDSITFAVTGLPLVAFKTIAVSGQDDVVADSAEDTLTLVAGTGISIATNAGSDSITITATGGGGGSIEVQNEGSTIVASASILDFTGGVTVTDAGGGKATVNVSSGGKYYKTAETIPAATWNGTVLDAGSGDAHPLEVTGAAQWTVDTGTTHTILNGVEEEIPAGELVQIKLIDGKRVIDVQDCS